MSQAPQASGVNDSIVSSHDLVEMSQVRIVEQRAAPNFWDLLHAAHVMVVA